MILALFLRDLAVNFSDFNLFFSWLQERMLVFPCFMLQGNSRTVEYSHTLETVSLFTSEEPDQVSIAFYSRDVELPDVVTSDLSHTLISQTVAP